MSESDPDDREVQAQRDGHCMACGYDLATLDDDAACPECGLNVGASRRGSLIDATTRATVRRGLGGLVVTLLLPAAMGAWAFAQLVLWDVAA